MGFARPCSPQTRLPFPDTAVPLRCPWSRRPGPAPCPSARSLSLRAPAQPSRQRDRRRVPRLPSFPCASGGTRAQRRRSPRESSIPPLQVLSPRLAGQGARLAAPAGSGLCARAAAGSAWASPAASERGAHVAQAPAWPTEVMKDQGEWVEKPYCLYLF